MTFFCQIWPSVFDKTVVLVFFARLSSLGVINLPFKHLARPGVSCAFFNKCGDSDAPPPCQEYNSGGKHCVLWLEDAQILIDGTAVTKISAIDNSGPKISGDGISFF